MTMAKIPCSFQCIARVQGVGPGRPLLVLHVMRYNTSYRVLYSRSSYTYMYLMVVVPGAGTQTVEMRESILVPGRRSNSD